MPRRKIGKVPDGDEQAPSPAPSILSRAFAVNLRRVRGEMERRQLAKAAGVSERHIWLIETKPVFVSLLSGFRVVALLSPPER